MNIIKVRRYSPAQEAVQLTKDADWNEIARWCEGIVCPSTSHFPTYVKIYKVSEPDIFNFHRAVEGEWIIRDVEGYFTVEKDSQFRKDYVEV
jgi:hypothetical protein